MSADTAMIEKESMAAQLLCALADGDAEGGKVSVQIVSLQRLSGGANMETWSFDRVTVAGTEPLILRRVPGGAAAKNASDNAAGELSLADEAALIDALTRGAIAGAGLDVYEDEPEIPDALLRCPRTVLLPHLGSATIESRTAMGMKVVDNLDAFFEGSEPPDVVGAVITNQ